MRILFAIIVIARVFAILYMHLPLTCVEAPVRRGFPTARCARCGGRRTSWLETRLFTAVGAKKRVLIRA